MEIAQVLKRARQAAGLTQSDVARRAATTQPAVAAYEAGRRTPSIATLRRLLDASDHDLDLTARPRMRRGAASLCALASEIEGDLRQGRERDALRLIFGFADDFRGSSRAGRHELLREEPPPTGEERFDAALAATAEHFAREGAMAPPPWVDGPTRFVEPWWFVASSPGLEAYVFANTPAVFARHGVFMAREVFDRA